MSSRRRATTLVAAAACLAVAATVPCAQAAERPAPRWLLVSDVHFTPFAGATERLGGRLQTAPVRRWKKILRATGESPSPYGEDTNAALLQSSLAAMRRVERSPPVVVVAGDLLGHEFQKTYEKLSHSGERSYERFVDKTIAFLAARFDTTFPRAQFLLTLGNNDSWCGDYEATPGSPFLAHTARAWEPLVDRYGRAPRFVSSFRHRGSYVARLPRPDLRVVSVDDVFWSAEYRNACGSARSRPGAAQARWLGRAMRQLPAGDRAWILTHEPPGIDAFATLQGSGSKPVSLLSARGRTALLDALAGRQASLLLFGHLHMSTYRLGGGTPMLGVPSISPQFGNNPAFAVATVGRDGTIADYALHALDLGRHRPAWRREYGFRDTYGLPAFDASSLATLQHLLATDAGLRHAYERHYVSGGRYAITDKQYPTYACASIAFTVPAFAACLTAR